MKLAEAEPGAAEELIGYLEAAVMEQVEQKGLSRWSGLICYFSISILTIRFSFRGNLFDKVLYLLLFWRLKTGYRSAKVMCTNWCPNPNPNFRVSFSLN